MNRALQALVVSCAAAVSLAAMPACAGSFDITAYGSVADPERGFDYLRLVPGGVVLSQMDHALLTGTFANGDYSTEYAFDDTMTLVEIDTATGTVTPIGVLSGFDGAAHVSLTATDAGAGLALVARSPCTSSDSYSVDLTTGQTTLIAPVPGCLQSMVYAPDGTLYALDRDNDSLVSLTNDVVEIGSVGFPLHDADSLAFEPGSGVLLLFAFNPDLGTNMLYDVDVNSGSTTLIGYVGGTDPISAVVVGGPLPDPVFADGFDG